MARSLLAVLCAFFVLMCLVSPGIALAQTGSITIVKDTGSTDPQDFAFYAFGPNSSCCMPFQLDNDPGSTLPDSKTFTLASGTYGFKEDFANPVPVTGWTFAGIACTPGANVSIDNATMSFSAKLAPGEKITCTFMNKKNPQASTGTLTIVKKSGSPQDFAFYSFGPNSACCGPETLDDDPNSSVPNSKTWTLAPGSYSVKEDFFNPVPVTGWALSSITCTGGSATVDMTTLSFTANLLAGDNIVCTFVNKPTTPGTGTLTIVKQSGSGQDFRFYSFGPNSACCMPVDLDDDTNPTLPNSKTWTLAPGSYSVKEDFFNPPVTGWALSSITCTGGSATVDMTTLSFTANLLAGDNIVCTFVNKPTTLGTGRITIVKDASPNDAQDFGFSSTSSSIAPFQLDDDSTPSLPNAKGFLLPAGATYTFTEATVLGWTLSGITCTGGSGTVTLATRTVSIPLAAGQIITCTFTNKQAPVPTGKLTIVKDAMPNDAQDFPFSSTSSAIGGFVLDDDSNASLANSKTFVLPAGTSYTVTEASVPGWALTSIVCTGGGFNSVTLPGRSVTTLFTPGMSITCTFTNKKAPVQTGKLTLVKDAVPNDAQDFPFSSTSSAIGSFVLDDDSNASLANSKGFILPAGTSYTITEANVPGWTLTSIVCTGGGANSVTLPGRSVTTLFAPGMSVICTFTNKKAAATTGQITVIKKLLPIGDPGKFTLQLTPQGGTLLANFLNGGNNATMGPVVVPTGNYTVSEVAGTGTTLANYTSVITGAGCGANGAVTLTTNANIVCTITNTRVTSACTGWPTLAMVNINPPGSPFGPQIVHICRGGKVQFNNNNSGQPWTIISVGTPTFPALPIASAPPPGSAQTAVFATAGTYVYKINGVNPFVVNGQIIVH